MITQYPPIGSESNPSQMQLADGIQLDAFGRLRVSTSVSQFDSQLEYGLDTVRSFAATANGTMAAVSSNGSVTSGSNAVGPVDSNTRMCPITVSTTNGHYSIVQSRPYLRYRPGKSHLVFVTGIFSTGSGSTASIVRRTSTSGSAVDNSVAQSSWNIDKLDGTGPSGITIDFTKTQILVIDAQWLGVGRVRVGFDIDGVIYPAHQFLNANTLTVAYTQTFNLPVRFEVRNTGAPTCVTRVGYFDSANGIFLETSRSTAGGTAYLVCCSVQSEGDDDLSAFPRATGRGTSTVAVTTRRPIAAMRPKATFNSRTNRGHINNLGYEIYTDAAAYVELVIGGTLTGASFASVSTGGIVEFDSSATAISGGTVIQAGYVSAGFKSTANAAGVAELRYPIVIEQIDALATTQTTVSLVVTSMSGTANMAGSFNWHEKVI
jgi:hypothetical protein